MHAAKLVTAFVVVSFVSALPTHHNHIRRSSLHGAHARAVAESSLAIASSARVSALSQPPTNAMNNDNSTSTSSSALQASSSLAGLTNLAANNLLSALFPVSGNSGSSWTTSSSAGNALPLSDSTLNPTCVLSALSHNYVDAPDGKKAMQAHYPKGAYALTHEPIGGISFYAYGPKDVDLSTAKEATFGYSVYFEEDFDFNLGGKLPGIYGGDSDDGAITCSGGRRSTTCFSARLMWRPDGQGELYTYLPPFTDPRFAANKKQCDIAPKSDCNPTYGASIGRGSFHFKPGQWTTVSERVKLNDVGQANGELQLFVGGQSVINVSGLILRDSAEGKMRGIQMQTFFGGNEPVWASPKDQNTYFSDFSVAILSTL